MAELNFGLLNPPGSQSIGNAFVTGMDQAQEARARDLQMQQSVRKGQMDELTYRKALDTEARLNGYYAKIAANGGPKTALEAETAMIGSGVPHIQDMGAKAQILRLQTEHDLDLYRAANVNPGAPGAAPTMPAAAAPDAAPTVVAEPGSFGADVAQRKAADPFAPAERTNLLLGAAAAPTGVVNNLPVVAGGGGRPSIAEQATAIQDQIERNILLGSPRAKAKVASLQAQLAALNKTSSTGGSIFNSRGEVIATAPSAPTELSRYLAEQAKLPPGDPRIAQYDARIAELTTAPGAHRVVTESQAAERNRISRERLAAETATGKFTPDTIDFLAQTLIQTGTTPPLGMGKAAASVRQQVLERAATIARTPAAGAEAAPISAADAARTFGQNKQEFAGATAGQRTLGTTLANVTSAATEANNMIPLVEKYAALVNPTDFPPVNAVGNYVARKGGGEAIVGLAGSLNSLVNAYARAINPKGVATVSGANHAREIINEAMAKGQIATALSVMRAEMESAMAAPVQVREKMRGGNKPPVAGRPSLDSIFTGSR